MVRHLGVLSLTLLLAGISAPVLAGEDCTCRGNGQNIPEGKIVCLNLPSGAMLARCDRVLNNTAWKMIQKGCPMGELKDLSTNHSVIPS